MWDSYIKGYKVYLQLEKGLSVQTVKAYLDDVHKLSFFVEENKLPHHPDKLNKKHFREFILWINNIGLAANSQARIMSGIKNFYSFLLSENEVSSNPIELLDLPKISPKLPVVLSLEEIDSMIEQIDHSTPEGQRNHCIIEVLYGCGLRVSELVNLELNSIFMEKDYLKVIGKGNKERIVPLGEHAKKHIKIYKSTVRSKLKIQTGHNKYLFLNRRGKQLTRVMVFYIIKDLVEKAGIKKQVSPHTFRHSFATHLVEGGADLRAVQEMLGHESITTTEIYTHLDTTFLRDTIIAFHPRS